MTAPRLREAERTAGDSLDLARVVLARVEHRAVFAHALRAEVEPADELAHDEHVDVVQHGRTEVRVHVERRPQGEQPLLGADVRGIELRVADRALEHGGRREAGVDRLLGKWRAGRANRGGADQPLVERRPRARAPRGPAALRAATSGPIPSPGRRTTRSLPVGKAPSVSERG